jgi:hypothetical protein
MALPRAVTALNVRTVTIFSQIEATPARFKHRTLHRTLPNAFEAKHN